MIDAYASHAHYWRHLAPIVDELRDRSLEVASFAAKHGASWGPPLPRSTNLTLVASAVDARRCRGRPLVYVEHGAGQTYSDHPHFGYAGALGLGDVRLFVGPGEHVRRRWVAGYPATPAIAGGCPALDSRFTNREARRAGRITVAFTFHWRCGVAPETMPAWPHYDDELPRVVERLARFDDVQVIGHGHPRLWRRIERRWAALGVEGEADYERVLDRADLLVADNTSAMYEAAAVGIPVLALNAPWYRRDVEHGLRFWSHVPGLSIDEPAELLPGVVKALADPECAKDLRARAVEWVYAARDGRAAARAADAIQEVDVSRSKAQPRVMTGEVRDPLDELLGRLSTLGATPDEVAAFREAWLTDPEFTDDEKATLRHASDTVLRNEILDARDDAEFHTLTPDEADAKATADAEAAEREALASEAYDASHGNVESVLEWVGGDPVRAAAVLAWEDTKATPRVTLVKALDELLADAATEVPDGSAD